MPRLVDLTSAVSPETPVLPGDPPVVATRHLDVAEGGYAVTRLQLGSHTGTHLDAPRHVDPDAPGVDAIDLDVLVGPARVVDARARPDEPITAADLAVDPATLPTGSRLLLRTGWSRRARSPDFFSRAPGLDVELARRLVRAGIVLVGVEQPSVDPPGARAVHTTLLGAGVVVVESLRGLDALRNDEVVLACLPLPLVGGDGAPVRAVAWDTDPSARPR